MAKWLSLTGRMLATRAVQGLSTRAGPGVSSRAGDCLMKELRSRIRAGGPLTVADFMKIALTAPQHGYYIKKDVFGEAGDFTTSPEISQLFGEMVAVWMINEWTKVGSPKPLQLVELGPGRGTMMEDILRVLRRVGVGPSEVSVHLVEVSEELSRLQALRLCGVEVEAPPPPGAPPPYRTATTPHGTNVFWYTSLHQVPDNFSCVVAHEFFDALPIHILKKTERGWNEILIDLNNSGDGLRYVLSSGPTPACVYAKYANGRDHLEVSPQSGVVMEELARRLEASGGIALVIDYGHDGNKTDTFRGFRKHQAVDPLSEPGSTDLTADVDFSFLKSAVGEKLICFGPVAQRHFLKQLHIHVRLEMLLKSCQSEERREELRSGYEMIMAPDKMGERFKVASFFPAVLEDYLKQHQVVGFVK